MTDNQELYLNEELKNSNRYDYMPETFIDLNENSCIKASNVHNLNGEFYPYRISCKDEKSINYTIYIPFWKTKICNKIDSIFKSYNQPAIPNICY